MSITDYKFVEIVQGGTNKRGNVVELPEGKNNYELDYYGKTGGVDSFHSAFLHTVDYLNYTDDKGGKSGYSGKVFSGCLFWDLDNHDVERAKEDTIELTERLFAYSKHNVRIYFSGNKGFHVIYICPELIEYADVDGFENIIKKTCVDIASNLVSFDNRIYDKTRIIRTSNSKNSKTHLYKIPVSYEELKLLTVDSIRDIAKSTRKLDYLETINHDDDLAVLIKQCAESKDQKTAAFSGNQLIDGVLYGFETGSRNNGLASLAGLLHSRDLSKDIVLPLIRAVNASSPDPLPEVEVERIVSSISRYPVKQEYARPTSKDIVTIEDAANSWYNIMGTTNFCSFGERFEHINQRMKMCIPGDVIAIVAGSGVGKTTLAMEFGKQEARSKNSFSLIASLEMSQAGLFFRASTIESENHVDNYVPVSGVANDLMSSTDLKCKVIGEWKNLLIIDKGGLSLDRIVEYYKKAQEIYDGKISNLIIDYAQNIQGAEDITYAMVMARKFKEVAKELNTKLFVAMQTNKTYQTDYMEVNKIHIEGAGAYVQACDYIIAFWKSMDQDNRLHGKFLKDRWNGPNYQFDMVRDGLKYHSENYVPDKNNYGGL